MKMFPLVHEQPKNHCGECTLCCKVMGIADMPNDEPIKEKGDVCKYLHKDGCTGCTIYETKPNSCTTYECMWLGMAKLGDIDERGPVLPVELRPDKVNAVINPMDGDLGVAVMLDPDYPNAWMEPLLHNFMLDLLLVVPRVLISLNDEYWIFKPNGGREKLVKLHDIEHGVLLVTADSHHLQKGD